MHEEAISQLKKEWSEDHRWQGVERPYSAEDVLRLRGSLKIEYTLARHGAEKLWHYLQEDDWVNALGAVTGNQATFEQRFEGEALF